MDNSTSSLERREGGGGREEGRGRVGGEREGRRDGEEGRGREGGREVEGDEITEHRDGENCKNCNKLMCCGPKMILTPTCHHPTILPHTITPPS